MRYAMIALLLLLCGCASPKWSWLGRANTGKAEERESRTLTEDTSTEVSIVVDDVPPPELADDPLVVTVFGREIKAPAGAKITVKSGNELRDDHSWLATAKGDFKITSNTGLLTIGGGVVCALGLALWWFVGPIGAFVAIVGGGMICCGLFISWVEANSWVIGVVAGVAVLVGLWWILSHRKDKQSTEALYELTGATALLSQEDIAKIKAWLNLPHVSAQIRKTIDKARGKA